MKFFFLVFLISCISIFPPFFVHANSTDLPLVSIPPGSFYYSFKRLSEKIMVNFYINPESKMNYYKDLFQNRIAELQYIIDKKYLDQVEQSTQRVSYEVGILTDYVVAEKLNSQKKNLVDLFKGDKIILEKLRDKYPANSSFWMLVQHSINSIDLNLQKF